MKYTCFFACILLVAGLACTKDKQSVAPTKPLNVNCSSISWHQDIAPLISNYCSGCHDSYLDYAGLKAVIDDGSFYRSLYASEPTMPINNHLEAEELTKIRCWLEQGAPDN